MRGTAPGTKALVADWEIKIKKLLKAEALHSVASNMGLRMKSSSERTVATGEREGDTPFMFENTIGTCFELELVITVTNCDVCHSNLKVHLKSEAKHWQCLENASDFKHLHGLDAIVNHVCNAFDDSNNENVGARDDADQTNRPDKQNCEINQCGGGRGPT